MNNQICQCGHQFSRDEHNACPACGSLPGHPPAPPSASTCEYKLNSRRSASTQIAEDAEGHRTSLQETNAIKKTEAEIRKIKT